jgi:hypothetical protein
MYGAPCKARNFNVVYIYIYIYIYIEEQISENQNTKTGETRPPAIIVMFFIRKKFYIKRFRVHPVVLVTMYI